MTALLLNDALCKEHRTQGFLSVKAYRVFLRALIFMGLILIVKGGYMQAKAHFAQFLIEQAWEKTLQDNLPHKPWPWADTHPIAQMDIDFSGNSKGVDDKATLYILAGASGRNLAFGPAMVLSGARPGEVGNTVIAGHRDTHFSILQNLQKGQVINVVNSSGRKLAYRVESLTVVHQSEVDVMAQTSKEQLTLITCYPFNQITGGAQLRYVVKAAVLASESLV